MKLLVKKIKRTFGFLLNHPLGQRNPVKTLTRFCFWQLQTRLSPSKLVVKSFLKPVKFYANKGLTGITGNIYSGLHEFDDMGFLLHFLRPEDIFFDIGANVGSYTLLASGICGANSTAIEPAQKTFSILTNNIQLNNLQQKVTLLNAIAGGNSSFIAFTQGEDTKNHVLSADESGSDEPELPVITVDSLLPKGTPTLIKIDVEGYETEVLKGMNKTLDEPSLKAIIIELNGSGKRYGFDESKIHELLLLKGFQPYTYAPFSRQLNRLETYGAYNTIYCRNINIINTRTQSAKAFKVMGETI